MERVSFQDVMETFIGYGASVWIAIFVALAVFVVEIILCKNGVIFSGVEKRIAKAKKAGKTLSATRVNSRYNDREPKGKTANRMYIALYEYYVGNKRFTKQVVSTSVEPPRSITLYYLNSPKKAFSEYETGKNPLICLIYIIPVLAAYFVIQILGKN